MHTPPDMNNTGYIYLVGAGPGAPDLLTVRAQHILANADRVLHDILIPSELLETIPQSIRECVGKRGYGPRVPQSYTTQRMIEYARAGETVVRLKCGDAFVFGRGGEEAEALRDAGLPFEVVPGLSSSLASASSAYIPATHRGLSRHFSVVTARTITGEQTQLVKTLLDLGGTIIVMMGVRAAPAIAQALLASGVSNDLPTAIVSRATHTDEQIFRTTLDELEETIRSNSVERPATLIFGRTAALTLAPSKQSVACQRSNHMRVANE